MSPRTLFIELKQQVPLQIQIVSKDVEGCAINMRIIYEAAF